MSKVEALSYANSDKEESEVALDCEKAAQSTGQ